MKPKEMKVVGDTQELNQFRLMNEDMKKVLKSYPNSNFVDDLTDAIVNNLRYSDNSLIYPDLEKVKPDDGVVAEWFYPIYNGTNDFAELTAILMYTSQETKFEEIGELMLGIGLTEMKHYAKLGDLISKLGGKIDQGYTNEYVTIGNTPRKALETALESEVATIEFYDKLYSKIEKVNETDTTIIAMQLISKITADEEVHKKLLEEALQEFSKREEKERKKLENL